MCPRTRPGRRRGNVVASISSTSTSTHRRAARGVRGGQVNRRRDAVRERLRAERACDVRAGVSLRNGTRSETAAGKTWLGQSVDTEAPPVVAAYVERHQVPTPSRGHELMRLHQAARLLAFAAAVVEPSFDVVTAGLAEHGQCLGVDGRARAPLFAPSHRRDARVHGAHASPQPIGQHLFDLRERTTRTCRPCRRSSPSPSTAAQR